MAATAGGAPLADAVLGVVSLILWSLIVIISLKYAILILRADNRGEGGIAALLALLRARHARSRTWRAGVLMLGLLGAALHNGDGAITPAISVLSVVEGLKVDAPQLALVRRSAARARHAKLRVVIMAGAPPGCCCANKCLTFST